MTEKSLSTAETHIFIIWENARHKEKEIVEDLRTHFVLQDAILITWSSSFFSNNLTRFYGQNLPRNSGKEVHCGTGPFLLLVVRDTRTRYEIRETSKGPRLVNVRIFDLKQKYRDWTGGGHKIHGTDTVEESRHDLALLLGKTTYAEETHESEAWSGAIRSLERDLSGSRGWSSIAELFEVCNQAVNYVVMRNFECLPDKYTLEGHGDIDILTNDYVQMCYVTNARPVFRASFRVQNIVNIGGESIPFDFRFVGDSYYDEAWQKNILGRRVLIDDSFFAPDSENHFYTLLYHAAIHKPNMSPDYAEKLCDIVGSIGLRDCAKEKFLDSEWVSRTLDAFLQSNKYSLVEPKDLSVLYKRLASNAKKISLKRHIWTKLQRVRAMIGKLARLVKLR